MTDMTDQQDTAKAPTERTIVSTDNRDQNETRLWLDDGTYVTVEPSDIYYNMLANTLPNVNHWYSTNWHTPKQTANAIRLCETVTEALHQGLDGWSNSEKETIQTFLNDIATGTMIE